MANLRGPSKLSARHTWHVLPGCKPCFRSRAPGRPHRSPRRRRRRQGGRRFWGAGDRRARAHAKTYSLCRARVAQPARPMSGEGLREDSDVEAAHGCERAERADPLRPPVHPRRGRAPAKKPCGKAVGRGRYTQKKEIC